MIFTFVYVCTYGVVMKRRGSQSLDVFHRWNELLFGRLSLAKMRLLMGTVAEQKAIKHQQKWWSCTNPSSTLHGNTRVSESRAVMRESIPFRDEKQAPDEQT